MNRRVLWVSTALETRGGIASAVRLLGTSRLTERWDVSHVATHRDGSALVRAQAFVLGAVCVLREIVVRRPAVVHLHTASRGSFARKSLLAWACYAARVPVIVHVHGGGFAAFFARSPLGVRRYITSTLERADAVIALGRTWASRLEQLAPSAEIVVVPNGVSLRNPVRQPPPHCPVGVLFLGALCEDKGAFVLLDAWSGVVRSAPMPCPRLVMAGSGQVDAARAQVSRLRLDGCVDVLGWVGSERVDQLLAGSQVLVLPSRAEGQPMAVLEAMAAGLCVVVTPVGGVPDLVDDTCAVLVAVDDRDALEQALLEVVVDADLRRRLGAAARDRVRSRFDIDVVWRELDRLYDRVVS